MLKPGVIAPFSFQDYCSTGSVPINKSRVIYLTVLNYVTLGRGNALLQFGLLMLFPVQGGYLFSVKFRGEAIPFFNVLLPYV